MPTQNVFTKEQESIVTKELLAIQKTFGLDEWLTRSYPRDGQCAYQYYLKDNIIWQYEIFTYNNSREIDTKTYEEFEKFASSMNKLVIEMWDSDIAVIGLQFAGKEMHKQFDAEYPCKDWIYITITTNDGTEIFDMKAPKTLVVNQDYPIKNEVFAGVTLKVTDISAENLKNCVDFYNKYNQLSYDFNLSMWKNIHQFIEDNQINQRLGLQNPPFSLDLYKLKQPPVLYYQQILAENP